MNTVLARTGKGLYGFIPGFDAALIIAQNRTGLATTAQASLAATWSTEINKAPATRVFPLRPFDDFKQENAADIFQAMAVGEKFVRTGNIKFTGIYLGLNLKEAQEYRKFNGLTLYAYIVTKTGGLRYISDDGIKVQPHKIDLSVSEPKAMADASKHWQSEVTINFSDPSEFGRKGMYIDAPDPLVAANVDFLNLDGIVDCYLVLNSVSNGAMSVSVYRRSELPKLVKVAGLVKENFLPLKGAAGAGVPLSAYTSATYNAVTGDYDIVCTTTSGSHYVTMVAQPIGTPGFEASADSAVLAY
jgi:hypothetical protein